MEFFYQNIEFFHLLLKDCEIYAMIEKNEGTVIT